MRSADGILEQEMVVSKAEIDRDSSSHEMTRPYPDRLPRRDDHPRFSGI